jgi:hypothetical protein
MIEKSARTRWTNRPRVAPNRVASRPGRDTGSVARRTGLRQALPGPTAHTGTRRRRQHPGFLK